MKEVENIFLYVDTLFIEYHDEINDILNACIFEA